MEKESSYHQPVLLKESVDGLITDRNGIYVDATFGGGGHSREVLSRLEVNGKLIGFDQDVDAAENIPKDERFEWVQNNFRYLKNSLRFMRIKEVDGVLADLGVSSHQFDLDSRGFSIRGNARLDMRMQQTAELDAFKVVNEYAEADLKRVLKEYGEIRNAGRVAAKIVHQRSQNPIESTHQLVEALKGLAPKQKQNQFLAQVFQAIRIEVNDELNALQDFLQQCAEVIKVGGKLVVISYHSLEDRLVKRYMKTGNFSGDMEKDFYGNLIRPFTPVKGGLITPDADEIERNNRARSAKLRIAERNAEK
jgi:16S rRNA (cytosine1402-N4)-methyltransferase